MSMSGFVHQLAEVCRVKDTSRASAGGSIVLSRAPITHVAHARLREANNLTFDQAVLQLQRH